MKMGISRINDGAEKGVQSFFDAISLSPKGHGCSTLADRLN
jgi:hypothetical protein